MPRGDIYIMRKGGPYYAFSFNPDTRKWSRKSTRQWSKAGARDIAKKWLEDGEAVEAGRVDRTAAANKSVSAHIDDYVAMKRLSPKQVTPTHVRNAAEHLRELAAAAGWRRLDEITRDTWLRGLERMLELRREKAREMTAEAEKRLAALKADRIARNIRGGREPKPRVRGKAPSSTPSNSTMQHWRAYWKGFIRWAHRNGRVGADGLAALEGWAIAGREVSRRRALTDDEIERLLATAAAGPVRWNMTGPDRMMLYLVALSTGFRAGELRTRKVGDFALDVKQPHLRLEALGAKNRKSVDQQLPAEIVPLLRRWLSGRSRHELAWPGLEKSPAGRMIRTDLLAANIERVDSDGRKVDFHALRHTFASRMARAGVQLTDAQRAMRHSSPTLTANIYTHVQNADLQTVASKAIAGLRYTGATDHTGMPEDESGPRPHETDAAQEAQAETAEGVSVEIIGENSNGLGGIRTRVGSIMSRWLWAAELPARAMQTSARQDRWRDYRASGGFASVGAAASRRHSAVHRSVRSTSRSLGPSDSRSASRAAWISASPSSNFTRASA